MASSLFLSDLHLPDDPSPLRDRFRAFLSGPAREAAAVFLLGDIFEYWIGDDVGLERHREEVAALRALADSGVAIYFMHGNRDFMVGNRFAEAAGVRLLNDPALIVMDGQRLLLSHGDRWCTDDRAYQRWRRFSRNRFAQWVFLQLPLARRQAIAGDLRSHSRNDRRYRPEDILDVNADAVAAGFREFGVDRIIHGHTHRPADHALEIDGRHRQRLVLADWRPERMEYLAYDERSFRRILLDPVTDAVADSPTGRTAAT